MIAFCIDASLDSGFGHFKRCLSIANLYLKNDKKCSFIILNKKDSLKLPKIKNCKFSYLKSIKNKDKIKEIKFILKKQKISQIVFDSYQFKKETVSEFKNFLTVHFNDFFSKNFNANININPGLVSEKYLKSRKNLYLGSQFSCIEDDYLKYRTFLLKKFNKKHNSLNKEKKIFIYIGTFSASMDIYYKIFIMLLNKKFNKFQIVFVLGSNELKKKFLEKIKFKKKHNMKFYGYVKKLSKILIDSNFAITGSGLINHEKLSLGIPSISIILAANQMQSVKFFKEKNFIRIFELKKFLKLNTVKLFSIINQKKEHFYKRMELSDALGSRRVYRLINNKNNLNLIFRKANLGDILLYYKWANNHLVRKNSLIKKYISFETHQKWFRKKLSQKTNLLFICADENNLPLGQIRYDYSKMENRYYIDISVDEVFRFQGLGNEILKRTLKLIQPKHNITNNLYSKVLPSNINSKKIFIKNNFKIIEKKDSIILFKYMNL